MSDPRCENCRFWKRESLRTTLGVCSSDRWKFGYHVDESEVQPDGVLVEDDEGWGFLTAPGFGCIHFQPKVAEKPE